MLTLRKVKYRKQWIFLISKEVIHEISVLSRRYGVKVWQSYLENKNSGARRMYWVYGPDQQEITIIGVEPQPEDAKNGAYDRITLSDLPEK